MPTKTALTMVGREEELALLLRAVATPPSVAVVTGEAGVGKTRLLAELCARVPVQAGRVLVARCQPLGEPFPFGPMVEALRDALASLDPGRLAPETGVLRTLFPELAERLPRPPESSGDARAQRQRTVRALGALLDCLGPALLVVEDLHWADDATRQLVECTAARPPGELSLVVSLRDDEESAAATRLRALAAHPPPGASGIQVRVPVLAPDEVAALAAALLGDERAPPELVAYLTEHAGGIPFVVEELLLALMQHGDLRRGPDGWSLDRLVEPEVPSAVRFALLERLDRLPVAVRHVVQAAAVLGVPAADGVLAAVAGLDEEQAAEALSTAHRAALLEEADEGRSRFRHALAGQAVYEAIPAPRRRQLHVRAARALHAIEPPALSQLAYHYHRAHRRAEWLRWGELAADGAAEVGDDAAACGLLQQLLATPGLAPAASSRLAVKLGPAALHALGHREAASVLRGVIDGSQLPATTRGELRLSLALLLDQAGDPSRSFAELRRAVEELHDRPDLRARAMSALAIPNVAEVPIAEHLEWSARAAAAVVGSADPALVTAVLANRAAVLLDAGEASWREVADALPQHADTNGERRELIRAAHSLAVGACAVGRYPDAEAFLARGSRLDAELHYERMGGALDATRLALEWRTGRWQGLEPRISALRERLADNPLHDVDVAPVEGAWLLAHGRVDLAEQRLEEALDLAGQIAGVTVIASPAGALCRLLLAREDAGQAARAAACALDLLARKGLWTVAADVVAPAVDAFLAEGRIRDARHLEAAMAEGVRDRDAPAAAAALAHAGAQLAEAEGRREEAAGRYADAAGSWEALPAPYEAAQARERGGRCLLLDGQRRGVPVLHEALEAFERLGAAWDAARCRRSLRRHGVPVPRPWRGGQAGYGTALSPRQLEIVQLAAAGRTNAEIAAEIFLSPKTVEHYLSAAMHKLGVSSRRRLADALRLAPGPGGSPASGASPRRAGGAIR